MHTTVYEVWYKGVNYGEATLSETYGIADQQARTLLGQRLGCGIEAREVTLVEVAHA